MKKITLLLLLVLSNIVSPEITQAQLIYTYAGTGTAGYSGDGGSSNGATFDQPFNVAVDTAGNIYVADFANNVVRKVNGSGIISTVAGNNIAGYSGDGGNATGAQLNGPSGVAVDIAGNIYIADQLNNRIRKVSTGGIITTITGNGTAGYAGDTGVDTAAEINLPMGVAIDDTGSIYIADYGNNAVRKIDTSGHITTFAGNGTAGYSGNGTLATTAQLHSPTGVAIGPSGVYIADDSNNVVRKVDGSGIISTVAGNDTAGFSGDGGAATLAKLNSPGGISIDGSGNIYIADGNNNRIRKVNGAGNINTIAGNGSPGYSGDGGSATTGELNNPKGVAINGSNLFVADYGNNIIRIITSDIAPAFTEGPDQTMVLCEDSTISLDTMLTIVDPDEGQTETWQIISGPGHGIVTGFPYSATSNGGTLAPVGLSYTPTGGYSGADVLTFQVSDGTAVSITTISTTINPTPNVIDPSGQIICKGAATVPVVFTGSVTGTTFAWTNSTTSIGLGAGGSGNIGSFTGANGTSAAITGTITVTPSAHSCAGLPQIFAITVNPAPNVAVVPNQILCNGSGSIAITFSGTVSGTTYAWENNNTSVGLANSGTGNIASFTATNTGTITAVGTVTVTPAANSCTGTSRTFTISVKPTPDVNTPSGQTVCNGTTTSPAMFTGSVSGTTFAWVNNNTSIGLAASGNGNIASFTAINSNSVAVTATITVTPSAGGCSGSPQSFTITAYPSPNIIISPASQALCNGVGTAPVNFNSSVSGATYTWVNNNTSIGLANSGTGNIASFTALNTGVATQAATISVTPSANGCANSAQNFTITVNPAPDVATPANQALCNGAATASVNFTGSVSGTAFSWVNNNTNIGLAASGSGDIAPFTATNNTNAAITATVTVTPAANGCTGSSQNFMITVNPTPDITVPSGQTVCNGATTVAANFSSSASGATFAWANSNSSIGLASSGTGSIASFTAINSSDAAVTATVTATSSADGCTSIPQSFTISVSPSPDVITPANQGLCNGAATASVNFTGSVNGTAFSWVNNNTNIGLAASGSGDIASFTATNSTNAAMVATITITPAANGCNGASRNFMITVNPIPDITPSPSGQTVCNGTGTTPINFSSSVSGATYSWANSNSSIGLASSGTGSIASFTAINSSDAAVTATVTATSSADGCTSIPQSFTISVSPSPDVITPANQALCNGAATASVNFTGSVNGTAFSWVNNNTNIGLAASGNGDIASFTATNSTNAAMVATVTVTPAANGCNGASKNFMITVNPIPDITPSPSGQTVCNGTGTTPINFSSSVSGVTYSWANSNSSIGLASSGTGSIASFTAINSSDAAVTATVTATSSADGCTSIPQSFTISVSPSPDVITPANQGLCNGAATASVNFTGSVNGTAFSWVNNNTNIGLAASGSGDIASFTATNSTNAAMVATITITPAANGCNGASRNFMITVNPIPDITPSPSGQTVCNGTGTTPINFSSSVSGATYSWANSNSSIGLASSGTGSIASFTAINSSDAAVTATVTATSSADGCTSIPQSFTISVSPSPDVITPANQALCNGAATASVNFTGSVNGTAFSWVNNNTNIGLAASGNGDIASFTATNSTNAAMVATVTVTPAANGCNGASKNFMITVNPIPDITPSPSGQTVCNGTGTTPINFSSSVSGVTYSWANSNSSIGLASSGTGSIASFTAINSSDAAVTATVTATSSADGCTSIPQSFTISVSPSPDVITPANQGLCNGAATASVNFTGSVNGTAFSWVNNNTNIGLAASGSGDIAPFTATNSTNAAMVATVTVTPAANGCNGASKNFMITVNPIPDITPSPSGQTVCNSTGTAPINFSSSVSGVTYSWANSNSSIGLASSGTGSIASFTAINSSDAAVTATVTATSSADGCTSIPQSFTISISPSPDVVTPANQALCNGAATTSVNFTGSVNGTTFSWVNNNTNIGLAASGSRDIAPFTTTNNTNAAITATVTVTPAANGCNGASRNFMITVNPIPDITPSPSGQTVCNGTGTTPINFSSSVSGVTYSWANSNSSIGLASSGTGSIASFTAINSSDAAVTATVTATSSADGCTSIPQSFTISVSPSPDVITPANQGLCNGAATASVNFTGSVNGTAFSWVNNNTNIGLAASGSGDIAPFTTTNNTNAAITATITVTPAANGCTGSSQNFMITVNPIPDITPSPSGQTVCNGTGTAPINFTSSVSGVTYSWTNSNSSIGLASSGTGSIASFTAINSSDAAVTATVTATSSADGCTSIPQSFTISISPTPDVAVPAGQTLCNGAATVPVSFTGSVSGTTYTWVNNNTNIGLAASGSGDIASFTATNSTNAAIVATITITPAANACTGGSQLVEITVNPTPGVITPASEVLCNGEVTNTINISGNVSGTTYSWINNDTAIGLPAGGAGNINSFTAANTGNAAITATITVTPSASGCAGTSQNFMITVNPGPDIAIVPGSQVACKGAATTAINFSSSSSGATFNWANNDTNIGLAASGSGNIPSFTAMNSTNLAITATITVTTSAGSCMGVPQNFMIIVNPVPDVVIPSNQILCNGSVTSAIDFNGTVSGTTYNWNNNNTNIGLAASGSGSIAPFTATDNGSAAITATITIIPIANGCTGTSQPFTITANPTPVLSSILTPPAICDSILFTYAPSSATNGAMFTWSRAAIIGISNPAANGTGDINEALVNATAASLGVVYVYTLSANSCQHTQSVTVMVNPRPKLNSPSSTSPICDSAVFSYLPISNVTGATFNWYRPYIPGIAAPAASGTGNPNEQLVNTTNFDLGVTYIYTVTANNCEFIQNVAVSVHPTPSLSSLLTGAICNKASFRYLPSSFTPATSFAWSRPYVPGISPATASGIDSINEVLVNSTPLPLNAIYIYTLNIGGCPHVQNLPVTLNINPTPAPLTTTSPASVCANTLAQNFGTSVVPVPGISYTWSAVNATITTAGSNGQYSLVDFPTPGDAWVILTTKQASGCSGSDSFEVTIGPDYADNPAEVIYFNQNFIALQNNEQGYQWGYDNAAMLNPTVIAGAINQNYSNDNPDFANDLYWVIVQDHGCMQKAYYDMHSGATAKSSETSVTIFPNPADEKINVEVTASSIANIKVEILNIAGQKVNEVPTTDNKANIDVAGLPSGCYMVNCYLDGNRIAAAKFIKN